MDNNNSWKTKVLIVGVLAGALTGLGTAYLYIKKAEELSERPKLTSGEGVKIGLGLVGLMKMITDIGSR